MSVGCVIVFCPQDNSAPEPQIKKAPSGVLTSADVPLQTRGSGTLQGQQQQPTLLMQFLLHVVFTAPRAFKTVVTQFLQVCMGGAINSTLCASTPCFWTLQVESANLIYSAVLDALI